MNRSHRIISLLLALVLLGGMLCAAAEPLTFRGFDKRTKYMYCQFGRYPQTAEGEVQPMLWRVLTVNEAEGTALLMTEQVIDMYPIIWVDDPRDREKQNFRRIQTWEESDIYPWMNTEMAGTLFTPAETAVLDTSRGIVFVLNASEMCRPDYGFTKAVYERQPTRIAKPTDYAVARGVYKDRHERSSTYWVNDLRTPGPKGYRMRIVGVNGHMSYAGYSRQNVGIRPAILVRMDQVETIGGSGTADDPYMLCPIGAEASITDLIY